MHVLLETLYFNNNVRKQSVYTENTTEIDLMSNKLLIKNLHSASGYSTVSDKGDMLNHSALFILNLSQAVVSFGSLSPW